jgi:hypothetical protein
MAREYVPDRKPSQNLAGRQHPAGLRAGAIAYPAKQVFIAGTDFSRSWP